MYINYVVGRPQPLKTLSILWKSMEILHVGSTPNLEKVSKPLKIYENPALGGEPPRHKTQYFIMLIVRQRHKPQYFVTLVNERVTDHPSSDNYMLIWKSVEVMLSLITFSFIFLDQNWYFTFFCIFLRFRTKTLAHTNPCFVFNENILAHTTVVCATPSVPQKGRFHFKKYLIFSRNCFGACDVIAFWSSGHGSPPHRQ